MEQEGTSDAVIDVSDVVSPARTLGAGDAVEVYDQLEAIVRFFDDLDAALDALEADVDSPAKRLLQQVQGEMFRSHGTRITDP